MRELPNRELAKRAKREQRDSKERAKREQRESKERYITLEPTGGRE